ncbi:Rab family GTPase [Legionella sp. WA2022007384]
MFDKIEQDYDKLYKIVFLGNESTGKTQFIKRYVDGSYNESESYIANIGKNFYVSPVKNKIKFTLYDTAKRQDRFAPISANYDYRGAHAYVIAFDPTNPQSLKDIDAYWIPNLVRYVNNDTPIVILSTKSDLEEAELITENEVNEFASRLSTQHKKNISYFGKASAKNDTNVNELFDYVVKKINPEYSKKLPDVPSTKTPMVLTRLLLEVSVPSHVNESTPQELGKQVAAMAGYQENNLHISLGILSADLENLALKNELIIGLSEIFEKNPLPQRILLNAPEFSKNHRFIVMPTKAKETEALESLHVAVRQLVAHLQEKYTKSCIEIDRWDSFQSHVTLFGQLTENLQIPADSNGSEFIPTVIKLRNNDDLVHSWDIRQDKLLTDAASELYQGLKKSAEFRKGTLPTTHFREIQTHLETAECFYKNCNRTQERMLCLIEMGLLSTTMYRRRYGDSTISATSFYTQSIEAQLQAGYRLRAVAYAIEVARLLSSLSDEELQHSKELPTKIHTFLEENKTLLSRLSSVASKLSMHGIHYETAMSSLSEALERVAPENNKFCLIM